MLQLLLGLIGLVIAIAAAVATYYAFSYIVLYIVGRVLPLAGRHKRR